MEGLLTTGAGALSSGGKGEDGQSQRREGGMERNCGWKSAVALGLL